MFLQNNHIFLPANFEDRSFNFIWLFLFHINARGDSDASCFGHLTVDFATEASSWCKCPPICGLNLRFSLIYGLLNCWFSFKVVPLSRLQIWLSITRIVWHEFTSCMREQFKPFPIIKVARALCVLFSALKRLGLPKWKPAIAGIHTLRPSSSSRLCIFAVSTDFSKMKFKKRSEIIRKLARIYVFY